MNQKEAVFQAVTSVMEGHSSEEAYQPTSEERSNIIAIVVEGFEQGQVTISDAAKAKYDTTEKLKGYTSGLVHNWLRKDDRLNGGVKYQPKNPGSRTGNSDPELKALRQLAKQFQGVDQEKFEAINSRIESKLATIRAEKAKKSLPDLSVLPADLLEELGIEQE